MSRHFLYVASLLLLAACGNRGAAPKSSQSAKDALKGAWTNGLTKGPTFFFLEDSVYYPDRQRHYSYKLDGDTILIQYEGQLFKSLYQLEGDTLFMWTDYDYGAIKLWRPAVH